MAIFQGGVIILILIYYFGILALDFMVLYFKKETVFSVHGPANFNGRHPFAFESHNPASMGKMLIPGDIIM